MSFIAEVRHCIVQCTLCSKWRFIVAKQRHLSWDCAQVLSVTLSNLGLGYVVALGLVLRRQRLHTTTTSCLKVKGVDIFIHNRLQKTRTAAYWPALTVGSAAQLAAVHCPKEPTLHPQSAAQQTHICPSQPHYGLQPQCSPATTDYF